MRALRKRLYIFTGLMSLSALWSIPVHADPSLSVSISAESRHLALAHDASGLNPIYGNPTSILEYDVLVSPDIIVRLDDITFAGTTSALSGSLGLVNGTFRDRDFLATGLAFSDTASITRGETASLNMTVLFDALSIQAWQTSWKPFVSLSGSVISLRNYGAVCQVGCAGTIIPLNAVAIGQDIFELAAAMGVEGSAQITDELLIKGFAKVGTERAHILDSHYFRPDLGPTPNVAYALHQGRFSAGMEVEWQLSPTSTLRFSSWGNIGLGLGGITYSAAAIGSHLPAYSFSRALGGSIGIESKF